MRALLTEIGVLCPITGRIQWRPRFGAGRLKRSPYGRPMLALGLRIGYWPCVYAPFVTVCVGNWRVDLWCGLPAYWGKD